MADCRAVQVAEFDAFTKSMGPEFTVAGKNAVREVHILSTSGVILRHGAVEFRSRSRLRGQSGRPRCRVSR